MSPPAAAPMPEWVAEVLELCERAANPAAFWDGFLACLAQATRAERAVALRRKAETEDWRLMREWSAPGQSGAGLGAFRNALPGLAESAVSENGCARDIPLGTRGVAGHGIALPFPLAEGQGVLVVFLAVAPSENSREALAWMRALAPIPALFHRRLTEQGLRGDARRLEQVLETLAVTGAADAFLPAVLGLCNELSAQLSATRVSLAWLEQGRMRLRAVSRCSRFDRRGALAKAIEAVMEECADQDEEVLWPPPAGAGVVSRCHGEFAAAEKLAAVLTLPIRQGDAVVAALCLERAEGPSFGEGEILQSRLLLDQASVRLLALRERERPWWRGSGQTRKRLGRFLGPEHTWTKLGVIAGSLLLAYGVFGRLPHRVEGTFILRAVDSRTLTAPFGGYLEEAGFRPGDPVREGDVLLRFAQDELLLQEAEATAEGSRYEREAERARSAGDLGAMRVSMALAAQARARLDMVRHRLSLCELRAPFDGVVAEGDLRARLGTAVQAADPLLRVVRLEGLYVEAEVPERDAHFLRGREKAEISFVTRPDLVFPVRVEHVSPSALPREKGNVFPLRARPEEGLPDWWRPGMSGVCKIDAGRRSPLWLLTHRTVDFLRMWLWY